RPRFSGAVGLQRFGAGDGGGSVGLTLGGSVTLPSTARRANQAALASADAEIAAATAELDAAVALTRAELAAARERYEAARVRLSAFDAALLRGAREEREAALASFRTGELSLMELLDFERALARAETERLRSAVDAANALADLYAAGAVGDDHDAPADRGGNDD
ncbi:TolC family protein, partial [Longimicrobium sp.]|uniref:TolC family protein n=1 Tax=Longimicrobium sp. TaxID=2029185 RepID=UPI002E33AAB1